MQADLETNLHLLSLNSHFILDPLALLFSFLESPYTWFGQSTEVRLFYFHLSHATPFFQKD